MSKIKSNQIAALELSLDPTPALGGNLNVSGFNIGDATTPDTYIDIDSDAINFYIGPSGSSYWDNTVSVLDATSGTTGETAAQTTSLLGKSSTSVGIYPTHAGTVRIAGGNHSNNRGGAARMEGGSGGTGQAGAVISTYGGANTTGPGAGVRIASAAGLSTSQPGNIQVYAGAGTTSQIGGDVVVKSGSGGANAAGGVLNITGGAGTTNGDGGSIILTPGIGGNTTGVGGNLNLYGGNAGGGGNNSGSIILTPGGSVGNAGHIDMHAPLLQTGQVAIRMWRDTNVGHTTGNYVSLGVRSDLASNITFQLPSSNGTNGYVLTTDGVGNTEWLPSPPPLTERIIVTGSPISEVINTIVTTTATGGSPSGIAYMQVFRNGSLQDEDISYGGSPATITEDYAVTGTNQITFAPGILQLNDKIKIYVFG